MIDNIEAERITQQLADHPDYRILRRLPQDNVFSDPAARPIATGVIVDTETTGLNSTVDRIIELAMICFEYNPETGEIYRIDRTYDALEDPGIPLSAETTALTGITTEMVAGQRIDDEQVKALLADVSIVIAHNAAFDRGFMERRFPVFEALPWACTFAEIDWNAEGYGTRKLDYLVYRNGFFFEAHRAETDCRALLQVLRSPLPVAGVPPLKLLLDRLPDKEWTVFAVGSPFSSKDALKARAYQWDPHGKVWHRALCVFRRS